MPTNATKRRQRRDTAKTTQGSLSVPVVVGSGINSRIGVCQLCNRGGLVNDEGVCTGMRAITAMPFFEPRSKRCGEIADERERKCKERDRRRGRA